MENQYDKQSDPKAPGSQTDAPLKIRTLLQKPDGKNIAENSSQAMSSDMLTFLPASDVGVPKNEAKQASSRLRLLSSHISNRLTTFCKRIHSTSNASLLTVQHHIASLAKRIAAPKITIKPTVFRCSSWVETIEHYPARTNALAPGLYALKTTCFPFVAVHLHRLTKSTTIRTTRIYKAASDLKNRAALNLIRNLILTIKWMSRTFTPIRKCIISNLNGVVGIVHAIQIPKMNTNPSVFNYSNWIELFEHIPENTNVLTPWLGTLKARLLPTVTSYVNYMKVMITTRITNVSRLLEDQNNRRLLDLTSIFLTIVLLILLWAGRTQLGL